LVNRWNWKIRQPESSNVHSHIGVYPAPEVDANSDGNELTNPVTANVWAEHSSGRRTRKFRERSPRADDDAGSFRAREI